MPVWSGGGGLATDGKAAIEMGNRDPLRHVSVRTEKGHEPDCKCGTTETRPSIVLDPFLGSGTTAEVARKHGCNAIGIELNPDYILVYEREKEKESIYRRLPQERGASIWCHGLPACQPVAIDACYKLTIQ